MQWSSSTPNEGTMEVVSKTAGLVPYDTRQAIEDFLLSLPLGTDSASAMVEQMVAQKLLDTQAEAELLKRKLHDWSNVAVELHSMVDQQHRQMHHLSMQLAQQKLMNQEQQAQIKTQLLPAVAAQAAAMTASMLGGGNAATTVNGSMHGQSPMSTPEAGSMAAGGPAQTPDTSQLHAIQQAIQNIMRQQAAGSPAAGLPFKQPSRLSQRLGAAEASMQTPISRMQLPDHINTTVSSNGYSESEDAIAVVERASFGSRKGGTGLAGKVMQSGAPQGAELQALRQELEMCQAQLSEQQLLAMRAQDEAARVRSALMDAEMDMQRMGDSSAGLQQRAQQAEDLTASLQQQLDAATAQTTQLKAQRDAAVSNVASSSQALADAQQAAVAARQQATTPIEQVTTLQAELEACRAALLSSQSEGAALRGQMSATDGAHVKLEGVVSELRSRLEAAAVESSQLRAELRQATEQLQQAREQLHQSKEQLHHSGHQLQQSQQQLRQLEQQHDEDMEQMASLQANVLHLQQELAAVKQEHQGEFESWQQQLAAAHEAQAAADASLQQQLAVVHEAQLAAVASWQEQQTAAHEAQTAAEASWKQQLQAANAELLDAASQKEHLSAALRVADERILQLEDDLGAVDLQRSDLTSQLHNAQVQSERAQEQLSKLQAELHGTEEQLQGTRAALYALQQQMQEAQLQLQGSNAEVLELKAQLQASRMDAQQARIDLDRQAEDSKVQQEQAAALLQAAELHAGEVSKELLQVQQHAADAAAAALEAQQLTQQQLQQAAEELRRAEAALAERQDELAALQEQVTTSLALQQEAAEAQQQAADEQLQQLQGEVQEAHAQRHVAEARLLDMQEKLSVAEQEQQRMAVALEELWAQAGTTEAAMEDRVSDLQKQLATAQATVRHLLDELDDAQQQAGSAEDQQQVLQQQVQELQAALHAAASESAEQQAQHANEQIRWSEQLGTALEEAEKLQQQLTDVVAQRQQAEQQLQQQREEAAELQCQLRQVQQEAKGLRADCAAAWAQADGLGLQLSTVRDSSAKEGFDLQQMQQELVQQQEQQQAMQQAYEQLQVKSNAAEEQCKVLLAQVDVLNAQAVEAKQQLKATEEELAEARQQVVGLTSQLHEKLREQEVTAQQSKEATEQQLQLHMQLQEQQQAQHQVAVEQAEQCRLELEQQYEQLSQQLQDQQALAAVQMHETRACVASLQQQVVEQVAAAQAAADKEMYQLQLQLAEAQSQLATANTALQSAQAHAQADKEKLERQLSQATAVSRQQQARIQSLEDDIEELSARLVVIHHAGHDPVQDVPGGVAGKPSTPAGMTPGGSGREMGLQEEVSRLSGLVQSLEGALLSRQQRLEAAQAAADLAVEQLQRLRALQHDAPGMQEVARSWPHLPTYASTSGVDSQFPLPPSQHEAAAQLRAPFAPGLQRSSPILPFEARMAHPGAEDNEFATNTSQEHMIDTVQGHTVQTSNALDSATTAPTTPRAAVTTAAVADGMDPFIPAHVLAPAAGAANHAQAPYSPYSTLSTLSSVGPLGELSPTRTPTRSRVTPSPTRSLATRTPTRSHATPSPGRVLESMAPWSPSQPICSLQLDGLFEDVALNHTDMLNSSMGSTLADQADMFDSNVGTTLAANHTGAIERPCPADAATGMSGAQQASDGVRIACEGTGGSYSSASLLGLDGLMDFVQGPLQHIATATPTEVRVQATASQDLGDLLGPEVTEPQTGHSYGLMQPQVHQPAVVAADRMPVVDKPATVIPDDILQQPTCGASDEQLELRLNSLFEADTGAGTELQVAAIQADIASMDTTGVSRLGIASDLLVVGDESAGLGTELERAHSNPITDKQEVVSTQPAVEILDLDVLLLDASSHRNAAAVPISLTNSSQQASKGVIFANMGRVSKQQLAGHAEGLDAAVHQQEQWGGSDWLMDQPATSHNKVDSVVQEASGGSMQVMDDGRLSLSGSSTTQLPGESSHSSQPAHDHGLEELAAPAGAAQQCWPYANDAQLRPSGSLGQAMPGAEHMVDVLCHSQHDEKWDQAVNPALSNPAQHSMPDLNGVDMLLQQPTATAVEGDVACDMLHDVSKQNAEQQTGVGYGWSEQVLSPNRDASQQSDMQGAEQGTYADALVSATSGRSKQVHEDTAVGHNMQVQDDAARLYHSMQVQGEPASLGQSMQVHEYVEPLRRSMQVLEDVAVGPASKKRRGGFDAVSPAQVAGMIGIDTAGGDVIHSVMGDAQQPCGSQQPHTHHGHHSHDDQLNNDSYHQQHVDNSQPQPSRLRHPFGGSEHGVAGQQHDGEQLAGESHWDSIQQHEQHAGDDHLIGADGLHQQLAIQGDTSELALVASSGTHEPESEHSCAGSGASTPVRHTRPAARTPVANTPHTTPHSARSKRLQVLMAHRERELRRATAKLLGLQQQLDKLAAHTQPALTSPPPAAGKARTASTTSGGSQEPKAHLQVQSRPAKASSMARSQAPQAVRSQPAASSAQPAVAAVAVRSHPLAANIVPPRVRSQLPSANTSVKVTPPSAARAQAPALNVVMPSLVAKQQQQGVAVPQFRSAASTPPSAAGREGGGSTTAVPLGNTPRGGTPEVQAMRSTPSSGSGNSRDAVNLRGNANGYAAVQAKRAAAAAAAVAAVSARAQASWSSSSSASSYSFNPGQQGSQVARASSMMGAAGNTPPSGVLPYKSSPSSIIARQQHTLRLNEVRPQLQPRQVAAVSPGKQGPVMKWQQLLDSTDSD